MQRTRIVNQCHVRCTRKGSGRIISSNSLRQMRYQTISRPADQQTKFDSCNSAVQIAVKSRSCSSFSFMARARATRASLKSAISTNQQNPSRGRPALWQRQCRTVRVAAVHCLARPRRSSRPPRAADNIEANRRPAHCRVITVDAGCKLIDIKINTVDRDHVASAFFQHVRTFSLNSANSSGFNVYLPICLWG